ncbi:metallophosphoesterase [Sangeribacter muris]|uniref:metallophosphoesterase n=1 Tax=Sangeribacter muris TaxID=2880703 RepID=UPI000FFF5D6F|nr:metallophosphoesterase [Sangeribacter muris]RXE68063.1 serine/threonine protein phosphatase [Muribaculaceae bacterium Isolate-001 (NCI)]
MKIQYASDLHLEFGANTSILREHSMEPVGDILVLAGDIGYLGDDVLMKHPFWDWASENFNEVIAIPGNHELYRGFDINELTEGWEQRIRSNVRYVYNKVIHLDETTDLIASTLWSKISPENGLLTQRNVSDFHCIRDGGKPLGWERFNEEHEKCRDFIERKVRESNAARIAVATHHVPSFALIADEFKGSPINGAFTSELGNMIADSRIGYWIYGHSHRNIIKRIGNTMCVCNQLGYVRALEHLYFRKDAVITL